MTEYYEEGGLLYEQSPPMHIKVESPEGPFGGGASENGFPREDEDSEGSCDQSSGLPGGLPFNVVVVHPNIMAPGMSSDDLLSIEQNRAMSAALAAGGAGKRKSRFSGAELEVLVSEVTRCEGELFGPAGRLRRRERERIWAGILERVNAVSRVPRTLREVKKRWDDLKRRNGGRLANARHRSCYLPSSRGASMLGRSSQTSPRLPQGRQKTIRPKPSFSCFPDSDAGVGIEGPDRDSLEKDEDISERDRDLGQPDCEADNSMEEKLGLGLSLGIGAPPPSERWLPPSPLYSAPFLNGSPQPSSPQPSLGAQQGPLEAPLRSTWLEDELRSLGETAMQLGNRTDEARSPPLLWQTQTEACPGEEEERSSGVEAAERWTGVMDRIVKEARGTEQDLTSKPKKSCLLCKDCGMTFNRRETFNLHRHFHAHQDELTPLTCRECGLTFQHRSSLVKHRNEHKEKEELLLTPKNEPASEEGSFKCAECEILFYTVDSLRGHSCCNTAEKPYHCPLCRQEFQFKVSVSKHMVVHSQECVFRCQECSQTFPDSVALRCHQRCHPALKPYKCPECGMVFKHYSVMEDHRRKHTAGVRSHLCNICGKSFKYGSLLHQHQYLHTGQKPFRCFDCGKKFAFAQNMKAHCRQHRLNQSDSSGGLPSWLPAATAQEPFGAPGKESTCQSREAKPAFPLCPQSATAATKPRAHVLVQEAEAELLERKSKVAVDAKTNWDKGHPCTHCPCVFRDEKSLNSHLLSSHKCIAQYLENVGAPAKQIPQMNASSPKEECKPDSPGTRAYKCSECGKSFRFRSVLELHMRMHSKDKPYQCQDCGKAFRFSSYLQQHLIIHTGKRPHKCPDCGKDFAFLQNMRTHQRLHQEKPFRCTSCRKGYSDQAQLQQHMLSHNGDKPHKCDLCSKSFGLAYLLRDHMNTHTGDRPHRCDECHKSFSWFSSLLVHRKIHARKRQGFSQGGSSPAGARMRGRGNRGKTGSRQAWGLPRQPGSISQLSLHPAAEVQQDSSVMAPLPRVEAPQTKKPRQWKVDGGEVMPVSALPQQPPPAPAPAQNSEAPTLGEDAPAVRRHLGAAAPQTCSPTLVEQSKQLETLALSATSTSTLLVSASSSQQDCADGAAPGSVGPADPQQAQTEPSSDGGGAPGAGDRDQEAPPAVRPSEEPQTAAELQSQGASGPAHASASAPAGPGSAVPAPASHGGGTTLWAIQAPAGIPKAVGAPEKPVNQDFLKQVSASWVGVQGPAGTQKVPISLQYDPHHFGQAVAPVWGFQSNPVAAALLAAQLKPGNGQELQQQPIVTGTQIIINQPSPFFSPPLVPLPPLALHSVPVGALCRPSHPKIFFTPQAVVVERHHLPQTLALPQLTPVTEPHKLGPRLPFASDGLLQCMICGCSLPSQLDLQLHYLQHAKGEI
ncbi:unnamed protein product [Tetraodon nigroviridis]|uniref:Chromosome 8 SCAF14587, whole genome shotgun sequence n=1 Tax=Tetraodon nigroviridis TaxID=99883 RepID=Q4SH20_TETNG|nr:unnamed protein product [Tetraodon nigroviridis]